MGESAYRVSAWWVLPISAVVWWVCGFLPWLLQALYEVTGLTEASAVRSDGFLPLPFTADDAVVGLVVMALIGGLLGGLTAGVPASARAGAAAATTGTLLAMSGIDAIMSVSISDGARAFEVIPWAAYSLAIDLINAIAPAFDAA